MMSTLERRALLSASFSLLTAGACAQSSIARPANLPTGLRGTVTTIERGGVRLHSYLSPASGYLVTSHVIETSAGLVLIDGQFDPAAAREVGQIVTSLGRRVVRTMVTHGHPDHWFGLHHLGRAGVHTGPVSAAFLRSGGAAMIAQYNADSSVPPIAGIIAKGEETIGGVTLRHRLVADTEAPEMLVVEVPQLRTVIVADLLFNRVHMVLSRTLDQWIAVLRELERSPEGTTILAGHGEPATLADVPLAISYLEAVRPMVAARRPAAEIVAEMARAFPAHRIPPLLELGLSRVFAA